MVILRFDTVKTRLHRANPSATRAGIIGPRPEAGDRRCLNAYDALRAAREDTLALVADLSQEQLETSLGRNSWSIGEILDHLLRAEEVLGREILSLLDRRRQFRSSFVYRSLREIDAPFGTLPLLLRLPIEGALMLWNAAIPPTLREWILSQRELRAATPRALQPRAERSRGDLIDDLQAHLDKGDRLANAVGTGTDFDAATYYSPVVGFTNVSGLIRLLAQHERRHQEQIREVRSKLGWDLRVVNRQSSLLSRFPSEPLAQGKNRSEPDMPRHVR